MKRVKITEEQYDNYLKRYQQNTTPQAISNMRHDVADLKKNELKVIAREYIAQAFKLGCEYDKTSALDMAQRKEIVRKLNGLQAKIDIIS